MMRALYTWGCALALWAVASMTISAETLESGMSGSEVADLQNSLVAAGYLARTVDGDYGSTTREAVLLFQKAKGLSATGKADDATREAIREAEGEGYRNGGGVVYAEGNRGEVISDMQEKLQAAGYLHGSIDGVYGQDTVKAVEAFQRAHDFPVSGAIDEMTYSALNEVEGGESYSDAPAEEEAPTSAHEPGAFCIGDTGNEVASIQRKLIRLGYLDGMADGMYGGQTAMAVRSFQKDEGLRVTGEVNHHTLMTLNQVYGDSTGEYTLSLGDSGNKVIRLQNKLLLHGYDPGSVDGVYGEGTAEAVRQLQAEENLSRTGIADGDVWDRLDSAPRFTGRYKKVLHMRATAYAPENGTGDGRTALGGFAGKGHAAVDPSIIPLGSVVYIEGYGYAICDDIGGAIHGMIIDVGVDTLQQAYAWGSKDRVNVYLVR